MAVAGRAADLAKLSPHTLGTMDYNAVAFGNGRFVAVGLNAILFSEDEGFSWHPGTGVPPGRYTDVTWGNGLFVAVSTDRVLRSTDGVSWNAEYLSEPASQIVFGNGRFLRDGSAPYLSIDGRTWTRSVNGIAGSFAAGNGEFIRFNDSTLTLGRSTDGLNWTSFTATLDASLGLCADTGCWQFVRFTGIVFAANEYLASVALAMTGVNPPYKTVLLRSPDATHWRPANVQLASGPPGDFQNYRLEADGTHFFFLNHNSASVVAAPVGSNYPLTTSPSYLPVGAGGRFQRLDVAGTVQRHLAVTGTDGRGRVFQTPDFREWQEIVSVTRRIVSATSAGQIMVAVGNRPHGLIAATPQATIVLSTNAGKSLQIITPPTGTGALAAVKHGDGRFIAVGAQGTVLRSFDGRVWSKRLSNTSSDLNDVIYGGGLWVAVGANGKIVTSTDGAIFGLQFSRTEIDLLGVTYGGGQFVAVGKDGAFLRSSNGTDWVASGTDEALDLWAVTYGNGKFVAAGTNGIVHVSADANQWQSVTIPNAQLISRVSFAGGEFLATEFASNKIYTSATGLSWDVRVIEGETFFGADASDGDHWVVGENSVIWKTFNEPRVAGGLENGQFVLRAENAFGDYDVLVSDDLLKWALAGGIENARWEGMWRTEAAVGGRFFVMRKRPAP